MKKGVRYRILFHLSVWAIFYYSSVSYFVNWLPTVGLRFPVSSILVYTLLWNLLLAVLPYVNYFYLIPKFYLKHRYWAYLGLILIFSALINIIKIELDAFFIGYNQEWLRSYVHYISTIPYMLLFVLMTSWMSISDDWQRKNREQLVLKKSQAEAELKWLKAQVNPHFLFNTLNNIYSLAYFNSEQTAPTVLKLSEIMQYMVYQPEKGTIELEKEKQFITNYLDLMTLKERWKDKVTFEYKNLPLHVQVEPLLFINFIENAFKHANLDKDGSFIKILLETENTILHFNISNTYDSNSTKDNVGGIGLENIKRRLDLVYPQKHKLTITQDSDRYSVDLRIELQHLTPFKS